MNANNWLSIIFSFFFKYSYCVSWDLYVLMAPVSFYGHQVFDAETKMDNTGLEKLDFRIDGIFLRRPPFKTSILMNIFASYIQYPLISKQISCEWARLLNHCASAINGITAKFSTSSNITVNSFVQLRQLEASHIQLKDVLH